MESFAPLLFHLHKLLDSTQCYEMVRTLRWPDGVRCIHCQGAEVVKNGKDPVDSARQHYRCGPCGRHFDDLSGTVLAGSHQPLRYWITTLYLQNLNVSAARIADELALPETTVQTMCATIREGIAKKNRLWHFANTLSLTRLTS